MRGKRYTEEFKIAAAKLGRAPRPGGVTGRGGAFDRGSRVISP